jgi:hypothetical protein
MVLAIKPLIVPNPQGGLEGKIEEIMVCMGLKADSTDYLVFHATR